MRKAVKGGFLAAIALGLAALAVARFAPDWLPPSLTMRDRGASDEDAATPFPIETLPPPDETVSASEAAPGPVAGAEATGAPEDTLGEGAPAETPASGTADDGTTHEPLETARVEPAEATPGAEDAGPADDAAAGAEAAAGEAQGDEGAPIFDILRVDAMGEAVVAGRSRPGATVELLLEGEVVASAEAGSDGSFVIIASLGTSAAARAVQLRVAREADDTGSGASETAQEETAPTRVVEAASDTEATGDKPDDTPEAASEDPADVGAAPEDRPETATAEPRYALSAPVVILPGEAVDAAPVVVASEIDGVRLVQPQPAPAEGLLLDRVSYGSGGDVLASGRGQPGHAVRVYANARYVGDAVIAGDGAWEIVLPRDTASGAQLLRFDEIDPAGEVTSRIETPFSYDINGGPQETRERKITVVRGDNLWRIAEEFYGEGLRYSLIFTANSGLIRDPDLIYPDQVFTIPELVATED